MTHLRTKGGSSAAGAGPIVPAWGPARSDLQAAIEAICLPDLIVELAGPEAICGLHPARGGVIRDPRPGYEENRPSFSVYRTGLIWRWKRHGGDEAGGNAYGLLLEFGFSPSQARDELLRRAGLSGTPFRQVIRHTHARPDPLAQAQLTLAAWEPLSTTEQARVGRMVGPLSATDPAARDLSRRGLWPLDGTGGLRFDFRTPDGRLIAHAGALILEIRGPDGKTWGVKARNFEEGGAGRYAYLVAGHGSPAWCSENYGQAGAVLLVEGELSAAAAHKASRHIGLNLDVQGLAGAGGLPHLTGLVGKRVMLYFDGDEAGAAGAERVARIAQAAGAAEIRILPALIGGLDFCDLHGEGKLTSWLTDAIQHADLWQPRICGKSALPQIKPTPGQQKVDLWQRGTTAQEWGFTNAWAGGNPWR